ncbi:acetyl esterase/lipase [Edaphobacter aggregans]|uniref:Acetyl esterase/lipase n=1 Tax=Edaphobacter aggregans TaxID=570835 RepID=A0A3R9PUJ6_9BACT|nr:alpha/beta hydrolase [Edaphobacter aggregans]RSL18198.1 acetyl esterase/lipase [Edaphobacter aggregans]
MKLTFVSIAGLGCLCLWLFGANHVLPVAAAPVPAVKTPKGSERTVVLWPNGAPGALGKGEADVPKLYVYPATGAGVRSAVIVMPGGGYRNLSMEKEGGDEARWLNEHGVTAFVLEYRLGPRYGFPSPMLDAARAIRYVRSHAMEMGIAKDKIGLWGFSAGGHLAAYLATTNDDGNTNSPDPIERVSSRPDFAILSYARLSLDPTIPRKTSLEGLIGAHPTQAMLDTVSVERRVTKDTPPCFLFATTGDETVNAMNSTAFYNALNRAGVPAELHIFERGSHGAGMAQGLTRAPELAIYPTLVANWMQIHGWMAPEDLKSPVLLKGK